MPRIYWIFCDTNFDENKNQKNFKTKKFVLTLQLRVIPAMLRGRPCSYKYLQVNKENPF